MCEKNGQQVNCDGCVALRWTQSVTQGTIWSNQVHKILFNYIWGETKITQGKVTWLSMDIFGLLITRGVEGINDLILTAGNR